MVHFGTNTTCFSVILNYTPPQLELNVHRTVNGSHCDITKGDDSEPYSSKMEKAKIGEMKK